MNPIILRSFSFAHLMQDVREGLDALPTTNKIKRTVVAILCQEIESFVPNTHANNRFLVRALYVPYVE